MIRDRQVAVAILKEARNIGLVNHLLRAMHPAIWTKPNRNILDSFDEKAFILFAQHVLGDLHGDDTDFLERDILAIAAPIKQQGVRDCGVRVAEFDRTILRFDHGTSDTVSGE